MLDRLRQLKRMWELSGKSRSALDVIASLSDEDMVSIPDERTKAVFMRDMTEDEYQEYLRTEIRGWGDFERRVRKILHGE